MERREGRKEKGGEEGKELRGGDIQPTHFSLPSADYEFRSLIGDRKLPVVQKVLEQLTCSCHERLFQRLCNSLKILH